MVVFWDFAQFTIILIAATVSSSETSVNVYQTARNRIPEDGKLYLNAYI
jgi:hypothetical protein